MDRYWEGLIEKKREGERAGVNEGWINIEKRLIEK